MKKNVALIGLGPHSKRIYINYFKKHNLVPSLLIDLDSNKDYVKKYLVENNFEDTIIWTLPDKYKDYEELPSDIFLELKKICSDLSITHIISSTEPKNSSHFSAINTFLFPSTDINASLIISTARLFTEIKYL